MHIDTFALARSGEDRQGDVSLSGFERLLDGLPGQPEGSRVAWKVSGESDAGGRMFMRLQVQAVVMLECQRCMEPMLHPVQVDTRLEIVPSESALADESDADAMADDDAPDQIVGSHRFDILELVEDELIMAVPYAPRHDVCIALPGQNDGDAPDDTQNARPSPFAALAGLKKI
ncbi:YceD family protein [Paracandidimonas soli]|uniref:YceD family protein n=1 Tax=Paracandidimonas soli TaxID=1917182 RepID=UPI00333F2C78